MRIFTIGMVGVALWTLRIDEAAAQDVQVTYLPTKEPLIYRKVQTFKQTQAVMDKKITTDMEQTEVSQWSVTKGDKGSLEVKMEGKSMQVKLNIAGLGDYSFDSRKDDNEKGSTLGAALTPLYERLSSGVLTFTVNPQGKVSKVQGFQDLIGDLLKENPLAKQFAAGGSDAAAMLGIAEYIPTLPEKPIQPGHRWETPFELNLEKFGNAKGKRLYVYEGEGKVGMHKTVKLSTNTELSFELNLEMGGAKVSGTISITASKGTIHFDPRKGCVVSLDNEYTVGGNLTVSVGGKDIPVMLEQVQAAQMRLLDALPK